MKPLPAQPNAETKGQGESMPSLPAIQPSPAGSYSKANRRASASPIHRAYPWLLSASTGVAALFCLMYLTKPVIVPDRKPGLPSGPESTKPALTSSRPTSAPSGLLPDQHRLPGESGAVAATVDPAALDPRRALPTPSLASTFEETNLRIQHVLTAEAPGGHMDRIDIDVPVLYQSRSLRWTPDQVAEARELLARLGDYQEKSRSLRAEGLALLDAWNRLIENSIPGNDLRADSPSLPSNQADAADAPRPAGFSTTESIQIQHSGK